MTREEIREGIDWVLTSHAKPPYRGTNLRDRLIKKLDKLGVVIKVDEPVYVDDVLVACYRVEPLI